MPIVGRRFGRYICSGLKKLHIRIKTQCSQSFECPKLYKLTPKASVQIPPKNAFSYGYAFEAAFRLRSRTAFSRTNGTDDRDHPFLHCLWCPFPHQAGQARLRDLPVEPCGTQEPLSISAN